MISTPSSFRLNDKQSRAIMADYFSTLLSKFSHLSTLFAKFKGHRTEKTELQNSTNFERSAWTRSDIQTGKSNCGIRVGNWNRRRSNFVITLSMTLRHRRWSRIPVLMVKECRYFFVPKNHCRVSAYFFFFVRVFFFPLLTGIPSKWKINTPYRIITLYSGTAFNEWEISGNWKLNDNPLYALFGFRVVALNYCYICDYRAT